MKRIGRQSQNAELLSYKQETEVAGTFMAYLRICDRTTNSKGYVTAQERKWWYMCAIAAKIFSRQIYYQNEF